jgi:hypothetical protein
MKDQTLKDLIEDAAYMLADRVAEERELIYYIAKMDNESRAAIVIAYEHILPEWGFPNDKMDSQRTSYQISKESS